MQPTRRRCLAIAGVGIGAGVAGCLSSGSNITYPEPEQEESNGNTGNTGNGSGESPEESESEPEPDPVENINTRLADQTTSIYEELRWFETEYNQTVTAYQNRIREVVDALNSLLKRLEDNGRIEAQQLEDVRTFADEIAIEVNDDLAPQFTDQFNFWAVNRQRFPEVERFRKREDWERVRTELTELRNTYRGASASSEIQRRHSSNPIDNRLYDQRLMGSGQNMFEVRYISDEDDHHPNDPDRTIPGYGVYVVNDSSRDIAYLQRPIGGAPLDVRPSIDAAFAPFVDATDRSYRLYVRIHSVGSSGSINPAQNETLSVYGQKYTDLRAADTAFNSVMADKEVEDTVQWGQETWNRVLYSRDGNRFYGYFLRAGSFLFAVGPSETPWEEREDGWNALLNGTWVNP